MPGRGGEEGAAVRLARIRKRRALSSSDASNAARRLRSRRPAVLLIRRGREGGAAMSDSSSRSRHCRRQVADGASARRLVTAFWQSDKDRLFGEEQDVLLMDKDASARRSLVPRSNASTEVSKSSRSRTKIKMFEEAGGRKGSCHNGHGQWPSADVNCSAMEIGTHPQDDVSRCPEEKATQLKDLYNSLIASKELAKVLAHIWGELNPSTVSLISALRSELDLARAHVRRLIKEQKAERSEIDDLKKELVEEMEAWKAKQKEKAATALQYVVTELDSEKKSRRRAERANEKLGAALADAESSLRAANKELERERKCRGRVEMMCGELVRGIGEDRAEVEALKREAEDSQRELEKEREMLHLADEWREQRVQMKLLEARLQFEEKNSALTQLHDELQACLDAKKGQEPEKTDQMPSARASENGGAASGPVPAPDNAGDGGFSEDCDSEGSDMHSIELNVDGNGNLHTWSYTPSSRRDRRVGAMTHGSFPEDRRTDDAGSRGGDRKTSRETDDALEGDWAEGCSHGVLNFDHDEERYQAIKDLREQMLAGSGLLMSQGRETAQSQYCIF
ncbi:uncharacterized protein LOC119354954 [Triticum dicoccoides]|uniref:uncharacterized protein LOC119354954 n=1 Tax=Triticum dicoccoides TaxID=85692 RepID=UPI000E7A9AED|nr:uncharacterized protein LOC119354954 [Triticum dicoccoides]XP_037477618.1 uncharacterized protein LOC119354954 [Triticum dicoccoides]